MARISGVTLPQDKVVRVGLTSIFGIGPARAEKILKQVGIDGGIRVRDLSEDQVQAIRLATEKKYALEGDLRREILGNIKRLREIGSFRGSRHTKKLPARGQRTKTNSRTVRGNMRKTMGSGRRTLTKT